MVYVQAVSLGAYSTEPTLLEFFFVPGIFFQFSCTARIDSVREVYDDTLSRIIAVVPHITASYFFSTLIKYVFLVQTVGVS